MNEYDAKHVSIQVNGKEIFGFSDVGCSFPDDWSFPKDNSKENQERLLDNFKYAQSEPISSKRAINLYNVEYVQIPHKDFSRKGKWIK